MKKYAIVVVGYNRHNEMLRLLESLNKANYGNDKVTLIISLDYSENKNVEKIARDFDWMYGEKIVRTFPKRQGLRQHILACGDFLEEYDAIAVLEDDLIVAPAFYQYMKQAVEFYWDDDKIAGISLYNHLWNVNVAYPFMPAKMKGDVYFLQFAQSWGQVWMKKQWNAFKTWYTCNNDTFVAAEGVPDFVCRWPNNSWLKYHIRYCVEQNKYFVYPYEGLTTCFSEKGEHAKAKTTTYQIPMYYGNDKQYLFMPFQENSNEIAIYDAFFERKYVGKYLHVSEDDLCVDIYGSKRNTLYKKYLISCKQLPYKMIASYALELRPQEMNVLLQVKGEDIFLYDTDVSDEKKSKKEDTELKMWLYQTKAFVKKKIMCRALVKYALGKIFNRR